MSFPQAIVKPWTRYLQKTRNMSTYNYNIWVFIYIILILLFFFHINFTLQLSMETMRGIIACQDLHKKTPCSAHEHEKREDYT